ncbi:MAG: T9SS type A sorting domain-containing protein, partial [Ignavibacteriales bacterium]|nr:T9SS type A sorting domain-containing protein [Ignavibacteriales bacterium]
LNGIFFSTIAVSKSPANRVYVGTSGGRIYRIDNANTGQPAMTDVYTGKGLPIGNVSCIAIDPTNADKAIAVFSNYNIISLFSTADGGATWGNISGNLEQSADGTGNGPSCRWAAVVPYGGKTTYFVGTSTGLYSTTTLNSASTAWSQEGASTIGNVVVNMIDYRLLDGVVVVATHGVGTFSSTVATDVQQTSSVQPKDFALEQNYPNPFNPSTTLRYALQTRSSVTLHIYDLMGREVSTLVNDVQDAGAYRAVWNGNSSTGAAVASGSYYAVLEAGSQKFVRKMILMK